MYTLINEHNQEKDTITSKMITPNNQETLDFHDIHHQTKAEIKLLNQFKEKRSPILKRIHSLEPT